MIIEEFNSLTPRTAKQLCAQIEKFFGVKLVIEKSQDKLDLVVAVNRQKSKIIFMLN